MELSSSKNEKVRLFRELLRDKPLRDELNRFVAEGDHLCGELARENYKIRCAMITARAKEKYPETAAALEKNAEELYVITEKISEYISDTRSPQGIFAAAEKPPQPVGIIGAKKLVLLDEVQDPGNVGTIIRTAEALGLDGAVLSPDCADLWSPKTLRASMGSVLRLPCVSAELAEIIPQLKSGGFSVFGAMLDDTAAKIGELSFPEKSAVVIGSEGSGISHEVAALCSGSVYIPISKAESLNAAAAAAIILWELSGR